MFGLFDSDRFAQVLLYLSCNDMGQSSVIVTFPGHTQLIQNIIGLNNYL